MHLSPQEIPRRFKEKRAYFGSVFPFKENDFLEKSFLGISCFQSDQIVNDRSISLKSISSQLRAWTRPIIDARAVPGRNRTERLLCPFHKVCEDPAGRNGCVIQSATSPATACSGTVRVTTERRHKY